MMSVKQIKEVRMMRQEGLPIREICRKAGISRNTVRKILRGQQARFKYDRQACSQPTQDSIKEIIETWVKQDSLETRKYRRTAKRMFNLLQGDEYGYKGSYASVLRCFQEVRSQLNRNPAEVFIPLDFGPGQAAQFDWGDVKAVVGDQLMPLNVGAVQLCKSRKSYARAYPGQKQELLFDVHRRAFEHFGGVPRRMIYDNLKTAVKKILKGNHRNLQERFVEFSSSYLYQPEFCNPAKGNEKGRVENLIGNIRKNFFVPGRKFASLEELNDRLLSYLISVARTNIHPESADKTRHDIYEEEKSSLMPLPGHGYECCRVTHAAVTSYQHGAFRGQPVFRPRGICGQDSASKGVRRGGGHQHGWLRNSPAQAPVQLQTAIPEPVPLPGGAVEKASGLCLRAPVQGVAAAGGVSAIPQDAEG